MAQKTLTPLSWGKPKLEFCALTDTGELPTNPSWVELPTPVLDTTILTPIRGEQKTAPVEGGGNEAVLYQANNYTFEFQLRKVKGRNNPIEHFDGVVSGEHALRLTPEDPTNEGILIDRLQFVVDDSWNASEGKKVLYFGDVLIPVDGSQRVKPYFAPTTTDPDPDPDPIG